MQTTLQKIQLYTHQIIYTLLLSTSNSCRQLRRRYTTIYTPNYLHFITFHFQFMQTRSFYRLKHPNILHLVSCERNVQSVCGTLCSRHSLSTLAPTAHELPAPYIMYETSSDGERLEECIAPGAPGCAVILCEIPAANVD